MQFLRTKTWVYDRDLYSDCRKSAGREKGGGGGGDNGGGGVGSDWLM